MGGAQEVYHHSDTVDLRTGKYLDLIDVVNSDNLDTAKPTRFFAVFRGNRVAK